MTQAPAPEDVIIDLEARRAAKSNAQARVHARESKPAPDPGGKRFRISLAAIGTIFAGGNVIETPPASIMAVWARHLAAARYYDGWIIRWPRLWWGAVHAWVIAPGLRYAEWTLESPPKAVFWGFVTWLTLHLLHLI